MAHVSGSPAHYSRRGIQPVALGDTPSVDAFGRLRTGEPVTLLDVSFEYDAQPLVMATKTATTQASVAHSTVNGMVTVTGGTSTKSTGQAIFQSYEYTRYQPGKSLVSVQTFVMGAATTGVTQTVGWFDAQNGVFLRRNSSGLAVVLRRMTTGGVKDTVVNQASWNIDPMTGNGPSGITLDVTKTNILWMDSQWLGVGRVRVGFDVDGAVQYVHSFANANSTQITPYARTWNLPLRWASTHRAAGTDNGIKAICGTVISEGGFEDERGITVSVGSTANVTCTTGVIRPVLSIRPSTVFKGRTNRAQIIVDSVDVFASANPASWWLYYASTTLTPSSAAAWVSVSTVHSVMKVNKHASTGTIAGGIRVRQGFIAAAGVPAQARGSQSQSLNSKLPLTLDIDGANPKTLTLAALGVGGSASVRAAINWREIR